MIFTGSFKYLNAKYALVLVSIDNIIVRKETDKLQQSSVLLTLKEKRLMCMLKLKKSLFLISKKSWQIQMILLGKLLAYPISKVTGELNCEEAGTVSQPNH